MNTSACSAPSGFSHERLLPSGGRRVAARSAPSRQRSLDASPKNRRAFAGEENTSTSATTSSPLGAHHLISYPAWRRAVGDVAGGAGSSSLQAAAARTVPSS